MFKLNLNLSKIATDEQKQDDGSQPLDSPTEDVDTATTTDSGRGSNTDAIPEDNNTSTVPKFNFSLKLGAAAENNTNETQQESVPKLNLSNISTKLALAQLEQKPSTPNSATNDNSSSRSQSSSGRNETKMPNSPIVQKPAAPFSFNLKLPLASNNSPATPADQNTTPTTTTNAPTPSTPSNISVQILTTPSSKTKTIRVDLLVSDMCTCQVPDDADMQTVQKLVYEQVCKSWFGTDNKPINSKKVLDLYKVQPLDNSTNQAGEADFVCKQTDTEFSAKQLKQVLLDNKMLKNKMEKSTQALMTFEKDNQRLRKELKQAKQNQVQQSSDKEVETLKQKLQKHEQLRLDMLKTVDSLKKQHLMLTQAILAQQQIHDSFTQQFPSSE